MSDDNSVNLKKGVSFKFEDDGNQITFKSSPYSGLEEVFVNGELVTSQKSYSKNTTANFDISNDSYTIELEIVSMLKGPILCTLKKNGVAIKKKQIVFITPEKTGDMDKAGHKKYIFAAFLGILFVAVKIYWELPFESFYYFIGAVLIAYFVWEYRNQEDPIFLMEKVEIE